MCLNVTPVSLLVRCQRPSIYSDDTLELLAINYVKKVAKTKCILPLVTTQTVKCFGPKKSYDVSCFTNFQNE